MQIEFRVDEIIKERDLNILQATKMCGLSYPTMLCIVHNQYSRVGLRTLAQLAEGLSVAVEDLFRIKKTPPAGTGGGVAFAGDQTGYSQENGHSRPIYTS